jgi:hypothetical protein
MLRESATENWDAAENWNAARTPQKTGMLRDNAAENWNAARQCRRKLHTRRENAAENCTRGGRVPKKAAALIAHHLKEALEREDGAGIQNVQLVVPPVEDALALDRAAHRLRLHDLPARAGCSVSLASV